MNISQKGIDLIKKYEGCILTTYDDYDDHIVYSGGTCRGTLTIGWGNTHVDIPNIYKGMTISQAEADRIFVNSLQKYANDVQACIDEGYFGFQCNQNMFDALCSFHYNTGSVRTLCQNHRDKQTVADMMLEYRNRGSQWEQGLLRRRKEERELFLSQCEPIKPKDPKPTIKYRANIQDIGWTDYVGIGEICGTVGQEKRLEAIEIDYDGVGRLEFQCHVANKGWQNVREGYEIGGSAGKSEAIEAIAICLKDTDWKIRYSVHVQDYGWMNDFEQGQIAGTTGEGKRMEAIKIDLI